MRMNLRVTSECLHIYIDFLMAYDLNLNRRKFCSCNVLLRGSIFGRELNCAAASTSVKKHVQNRFYHVNIEY